ncbi:MAG TPA: phosphate ABC transporter permease [Flavobacteriales bacterium]|nr:phosphate ABC transporter permease [Flavobacteriales bacterium]HRE73104.1 ABC transporter permease [Flavobacteriales bacterium]HRJ37803.1 ABC transporter permease [Flavobacteriales bacterium]
MEIKEPIEYEIKSRSGFSLGLRELWDYRELLYFFIWRDIKVRYKQTFLGITWVVLQPLLLMLVFWIVLGDRFGKDLGSIDYRIFMLSGFLLWNIFSSGLNNAGNSMVSNANIIKKIYFPRLIIPVSAIGNAFFDFTIGLFVYITVLIILQTPINLTGVALTVPALILTFTASLGTGSLIAALNVKYRDFRYALPFMIQALMFIAPVFYPLQISTENASILFAFHPMYAPIELFRQHFQDYPIDQTAVMISAGVNLTFLVGGIYIFRKTEHYFADLA